MLAAISLAVTALAFSSHTLHAAVTLNVTDAFVNDGTPTGDLIISGDLSVVKGIDFGIASATPLQAAVQLNYFASEKSAKFDITDSAGAFQWRDNLISGTPRNKMSLDSNNLLSLYNASSDTKGITLSGNNGQISLSGAGSGIYFGSTPVLTLNASGSPSIGSSYPLTIASTTAATSSTGALTVAGGISVAKDAFINGMTVGRGGGGVLNNTAIGQSALGLNTTGTCNTAIGTEALGKNTTGSFNTALGLGALRYNSTGGNNVAVGANAGFLAASGGTFMSTASNSIYIGADSRGYSSQDNNSIVIGASATGEGANTTVIGNANTTKTHLFGTVEASAITVNNSPVLTQSFGASNTLSGGALLSIGDYSSASQWSSIAIGNFAQASGYSSMALGTGSRCEATSNESIAMTRGVTTEDYSLAAGYGRAEGNLSVAIGTAVARGASSIAIGGYDWTGGNWPGNQSTGDNSTTFGGVGNQALGFSSMATGFWTKASAAYSTASGSLNYGLGANATEWVETDPLFELGNGQASRSSQEPDASMRSNAITTLKNGQTTLTNKEWKANPTTPLADPASNTDSGGEALVVDGHTVLNGKVIISVPQGDIPMFGN
jgi:hypothetical protein